MSQSEQIMLRYEYLMQATADAQGDFARTSDGYANSVRMLQTNIEQLKTNIGSSILPVVTDVIGAINMMFDTLGRSLPEGNILDAFAEIDLKTDQKIADIQATADKATATVELLDGIAGHQYAQETLSAFVESFGGALGDLDGAMEKAQQGDYAGTMEELAKALELKTGVSADEWTKLFSGISEAITTADIDASKITEPVGEIKGAVEGGITTGKLGTDLDNVITALNKDPEKSKIPGEISSIKESVNNSQILATSLDSKITEVNKALEKAPTSPTPVETAITGLQGITQNTGIDSANVQTDMENVVTALNVAPAQPAPVVDQIAKIKTVTDDPGITGDNVSKGITDVNTALGTEAPESMPVVEGVSEFAEAVNQEFDASGVESATKQAADALGVAPAQPQGKIPVVVALEDLEGSLAAAGSVIGENGGSFTSFLEAAASAANSMGPEATKNWELFVKTVGSAQAEKMLQSWAEAGTAASNMAAVTNAMSGLNDSEGAAQAIANLAQLGIYVTDAEQALTVWNEICNDLVQTIPSLGNMVNAQTGELEANIGQIYEAVDAWEEYQIALAEAQGWQEKKALVEDDPYLKAALSNRWEALREYMRLQAEFDKYGVDYETTKASANQKDMNASLWGGRANYTEEEKAALDLEAAILNLNTSERELAEAQEMHAQMEEYVAKNATSAAEAVDELGESVGMFSSETQTAVNAALESMAPALEEMAAMYESTRSSIESSVNSMMDGFEFKMPEIKTPEQQVETFTGMNKSLDDQIEYMDQYMAMLDTLKQRGVSADLLGDLSSGSQEDFEYLSGLMTATDEELTEMNSKYAEAKAKREEFVNSLTETNLEGDETYAALSEQVQTDMDTLTTALSESGAPAAAEATFQAILDAVTSRSASISQAIDEVVANWAKLEGLGFSGFGTGNGAGSSNGGGTPHAGGLDYVPFNGYMARLHEGESVLTAEQSRAWRSMMDGPGQNSSGLDYSALGGVIRDNTARSAGNVYLDGKTLGKVISDQQANSYNNLSRSGWSG